MLVEDDIENFLNYLEHVRAYSPRTLAAYRRDLKDWQSYLEKQGADEVSLPLARSYVAHLRSKTALSNRSINRRISALKSFYKYLQKRQRAEAESADSADSASAPPAGSEQRADIWAGISLLPLRSRLPDYLSLEELQKLSSACTTAFRAPYQQKLCRTILELGFSSGMRVSELCGINIGQILQGRYEKSSFIETSGKAMLGRIKRKLKITGKGGKQRFVFLGPGSVAALLDYLPERQRFLDRCKNKQAVAEEALFCNRRGARLQPRSAYEILSGLGRHAGRPLHPHLLRHSFATTLLNHGANIRVVQELLGHQSLNSTQVYTHVGIQRLRDIHRTAHPRARAKETEREKNRRKINGTYD